MVSRGEVLRSSANAPDSCQALVLQKDLQNMEDRCLGIKSMEAGIKTPAEPSLVSSTFSISQENAETIRHFTGQDGKNKKTIPKRKKTHPKIYPHPTDFSFVRQNQGCAGAVLGLVTAVSMYFKMCGNLSYRASYTSAGVSTGWPLGFTSWFPSAGEI